MSASVHVVLPNDIDDPATPSGGNVYDRRICGGLAALGWTVREHPVRGDWPTPSPDERGGLAGVLAAVPDDALVLLDGLVASAVPDVLLLEATRLRLIVLVHMPLGDTTEAAALPTARAVVTTSTWTRNWLVDSVGLSGERVHVAVPGVDTAPLNPGSAAGSRLLCVGAVTPHKGHDVLLQALAMLTDLVWTCVCAGSLSRDQEFVASLPRPAGVDFVGPLTGAELAHAYASADLLVIASRQETYGMVATEALARGIPVLATAAGGLPEALSGPGAELPGLLLPPGDPGALADALRRWLGEPALRQRLRRAAVDRRTTLTGWAATAERVSDILTGVAA